MMHSQLRIRQDIQPPREYTVFPSSPKSAWLSYASLCNAELYWDHMDHSYTYTLFSKTYLALLIPHPLHPYWPPSTPPCMNSLNILCHYHRIQFWSWGKPWKSVNECCLQNGKALSGSWRYMRNCIIQWGMRSEEPYSVYKSFTQKTTIDTRQQIVWIQKKKKKGSLNPANTYACT